MAAIPLVILAVMAGSVGALLTSTQIINNRAAMATVEIGVFRDITCTQICYFLDWGILRPGENKTVLLYIKNIGGAPISGSIETSEWAPPETANFLNLTWNFGERILDPGRVRPTNFTLSVAKNIWGIEQIAFLITVIGTEHIH